MIRKRKDFYFQKYDKAVELHEKGKNIQEIADELGLSYSAVYSWLSGARKPEKDALSNFIDFLRKNGPMPAILVKEMFPSHDDLYHMAMKRNSHSFSKNSHNSCILKKNSYNIGLNRHNVAGKHTLKESGVWYYLDGQENELKKRILDMLKKYSELKSFLKTSVK